MLKMPSRLPEDGGITIERGSENYLVIGVTNDGKPESIITSEYNAWRIFGALSLMLGIPLPSKTAKEIKMGMGVQDMTFGPSKPLVSLGDKVAHNLRMQAVNKELAKQGMELVPVKKPKKKAAKVPCSICIGAGKIFSRKCNYCSGTGKVFKGL